MLLVVVSDTHMRHEQVEIPDGDILIHAGDFSRKGTRAEMEVFCAWMGRQAPRHKVLVAGNHDGWCEAAPAEAAALAGQHGLTYLTDSGTTLLGLRLWGSPVTPRFRDMAFNRDRGQDIKRHWQLIPDGLDVLITHGPPLGHGDRVVFGKHVGCADLLAELRRVQPRLHVFGHIHEAYGRVDSPWPGVQMVNAAVSPFLLGKPRPAMLLELGAR